MSLSFFFFLSNLLLALPCSNLYFNLSQSNLSSMKYFYSACSRINSSFISNCSSLTVQTLGTQKSMFKQLGYLSCLQRSSMKSWYYTGYEQMVLQRGLCTPCYIGASFYIQSNTGVYYAFSFQSCFFVSSFCLLMSFCSLVYRPSLPLSSSTSPVLRTVPPSVNLMGMRAGSPPLHFKFFMTTQSRESDSFRSPSCLLTPSIPACMTIFWKACMAHSCIAYGWKATSAVLTTTPLASWSYLILLTECGSCQLWPCWDWAKVGLSSSMQEQKLMKIFIWWRLFMLEMRVVLTQNYACGRISCIPLGSSFYFWSCSMYQSYSALFLGSEIYSRQSFMRPMNSGFFIALSIFLYSSLEISMSFSGLGLCMFKMIIKSITATSQQNRSAKSYHHTITCEQSLYHEPRVFSLTLSPNMPKCSTRYPSTKRTAPSSLLATFTNNVVKAKFVQIKADPPRYQRVRQKYCQGSQYGHRQDTQTTVKQQINNNQFYGVTRKKGMRASVLRGVIKNLKATRDRDAVFNLVWGPRQKSRPRCQPKLIDEFETLQGW